MYWLFIVTEKDSKSESEMFYLIENIYLFIQFIIIYIDPH